MTDRGTIMKTPIGILALFLMISCDVSSGTRGPEGPPGPAGPVGQGFEVEADFNQSNNYSQIFAFPESAEVLDTDIVVVYWLFEVNEQTGNDVWQQLPATVFFQDGQFQYAFDHTLADVQLFLQGNIDLNTLGTGYTQNQLFRVAILPVDYVQSNNINLNDMDQVMGAVKHSQNLERIKL